MSKLNTNGWKVIMKVLIAIATTILGALGVQEAGNDQWQPGTHIVHSPRHSTYHYNHSCNQLLDSVLLNSPYSKHLRGFDTPQVFFYALLHTQPLPTDTQPFASFLISFFLHLFLFHNYTFTIQTERHLPTPHFYFSIFHILFTHQLFLHSPYLTLVKWIYF